MAAYNVLVLALVATMSYQVAAACPGCPFQQDPSDFSVDQLSRALSAAQVNEGVSKILNVTVQVVSGMKYTVRFETLSGKTCSVSWIEAPWVHQEPMDTQYSCRAKRSLGGFEDVDASELPELEEFGNKAINEQSNGYRKYVVKVLRAQKQVVNGMMYKAEFIVKTTSCRMEQVPQYTCMQKETAPKQFCTASIHASPYLSQGAPTLELTDMDCKNMLTENLMADESQEAKREQRYQDAAESYAVYMINSQVNSLNYKGLFSVNSVDRKLSAGGYLYTFELVLRDTDCTKENGLLSSKKCHFVGNTADLKCTTKVSYWPWSGLTLIASNKCSQ